MKRVVKAVLVSLIVFTVPLSAYCQGTFNSKSSIKIGMGVGASMADHISGLGMVFKLGYQKEFKNPRLRFNPYMSIGLNSSKVISDTRDQYYNSINIGSNLYFDLIKLQSFSVVIGGGALINNSRGLKGTGGDPEAGPLPKHSDYFSKYYFGGYVGGGLRYNPSFRRTAFNLIPVNINIGSKSFLEFYPMLELEIKL